MARCRFLELPLEVRDLIFEFTIAEDAYDPNDIRASSEYRRKRIAISRSDRWAWEAHHQSQAPFPEYLCLQLCNRQLNREIREFIFRPQRAPAVITMLLEYPHMWSIFTKLAQPPDVIKCLDIEIKVNHMYHPAYISRGSQSAILSAVSDIVKRFVHRGPHLSRPSPLVRQLHLDTVRITLAPHLPLAALSQVYGFPEQQLETLFTDFKTLLTRFCRSGIPYGLIDFFEVRRERGPWHRLPVTSNIWDEQDFVFFQYGGYNCKWHRTPSLGRLRSPMPTNLIQGIVMSRPVVLKASSRTSSHGRPVFCPEVFWIA